MDQPDIDYPLLRLSSQVILQCIKFIIKTNHHIQGIAQTGFYKERDRKVACLHTKREKERGIESDGGERGERENRTETERQIELLYVINWGQEDTQSAIF